MPKTLLLVGLLMFAGLPITVSADQHNARLTSSATSTRVSSLLGNDISWPQCGTKLPTGQAFGIVGVNNGLANTTNPCLATELAWAAKSSGLTVQPKVQLYVNTANPGGLNTASWPSTGTNAYGTCDYSNSLACAYQYGWNRASDDATIRGVTNAGTYTWWLDVETGNSWDFTAGGTARNVADLEGMTEYFKSINAKVGVYSTSYQWGQIVGSSVVVTSSLNGLSNWLPGSSSLSAAKTNCALASLTVGGIVGITQYTSVNKDYDYSCR